MRALALLLLLAAPARAETDAGCAALLGSLGALGLTVEGTARAVEVETALFGEVAAPLAWCEGAGLRLSGEALGPSIAVEVGSVRWRGLDPLLDGGVPRELWLEASDLRVLPRTGDPVLDWLLAAQQGPEGIALSVEAGPDADGSLRLWSLSLDPPGRDAVALSADAEGLDLASPGALATSLGRAGLREATASLVLDGLFERWLLMPLGQAALAGAADPEAEAARWRDRLADRARALPPAAVDAPSREALARLAEALPHPRGMLQLDLRVEGAPLGAPRLAPVALRGPTPEALALALDGVRLTATWVPLPPP